MSESKQWRSGYASMRTVKDRFSMGGDGVDRVNTKKSVNKLFAEFMQMNEIGPGEVLITERHEHKSGDIEWYIAIYTDKNAKTIETKGGLRFEFD